MTRTSGLYVRFFIPTDLQAQVGRRHVVRPARVRTGDEARLVAARLAIELGRAFAAMRGGYAVDVDAVLHTAHAGVLRELGCDAALLSLLRPLELTMPHGGDARAGDTAPAGRDGSVAQAPPAVTQATSHPLRHPGAEVLPASPRLSKAIADHLGDLERARLNPKTVLESRHTLRIYAGLVGEDTPVAALTADHTRSFFDGVRWWPSNASKREPYRGKPVPEVIALGKANGEPAPAAYTVAKHRQRLSVFFRSLVDAGLLVRNPLAGVRAMVTPEPEDKGEPFTDAQLQAIFDPVEFPKWARKYPHRWFGPILGLYSGARVNEIAQLRVADIETIEGIPGFHVRRGASDQSVKNKASRRFVPLAQPVIDAGFLTYVAHARAAGHIQLFPDLPNSTGLGYGRQLSRQFSVYIKQRGITAKGQGFHGFRHTFASRLDAAGASTAAIGALTGHATGPSVLNKFYIDRKSLLDRASTLKKFAPPVAFPACVLLSSMTRRKEVRRERRFSLT